ncbi:MAG TPA: acyltransferase family protein [Deltaproteobacteria bacterium]|nr:acyltransferase family protein [Candidatus Binatota bacterium]HIL12429.1 acyltransferase family protein [Deltaproteobacteria bacterium]
MFYFNKVAELAASAIQSGLSLSSSSLPGLPFADLSRELSDKIDQLPIDLNEYGYDPWGFNPDVLKTSMMTAAILYRHYFRVVSVGMDRLPPGRVLLVGNHAGQIAFDGMMVATAMLLEASPPRLARGMGEYWLATLPWLNVLLDRMGHSIGTPSTCAEMLNRDECVLVFPEGVRGMNKVYADAYQLQDFGLGFMRLALETNTPIVPFAVVGSEEQAPGIANLESVAAMLNMPAFPVTLTWPLLGPLGMLPLPVRYHIEFGQAMHFEGDHNDEDDTISHKVDEVKDSIQSMLRRGLAERTSIFL